VLHGEENIIDPKILSKTNAIWNQCRINHPWSVGYTSHLVTDKRFDRFDDWVSHYFHTGIIRDFMVADIEDNKERELATAPLIGDGLISQVKRLPEATKSLNFYMGRSWDMVNEKCEVFQSILEKENIKITERETTQIFLQRIIIDTWNGHARERNTVSKMQLKNKNLSFICSDSREDFNYGIDYWIYHLGELLGAIQIKPESYMRKSPYIKKAKLANRRKNARFSRTYNVPVWTVISKVDGEIVHNGGMRIC